MNSQTKIENILFYSIFIILTIIIAIIVVKPSDKTSYGVADETIKKVRQVQEIAPQRLYINAWRLAKIEFADNTMNNQNWFRWRNKYLKEIKTIEDAQIAINTMLASLNDPYTKFLQTQDYLKQEIVVDSKITGIGITFEQKGNDVIISNILPNSPAQKKKLLLGDKIVKINEHSLKNLEKEDIQKLIDDNPKHTIKIQIKRGHKLITKYLQKQEINIATMQYYITKDNIGIINLANVMGENAIEDFKTIIEKTNNTKGIIFDLRNNYGGILSNAIAMADYMSDDKKLITIESRGNSRYELYGDKEAIFTPKPIVVLVNNKTASAAEILAGNLKYNLNAIIIGENTYGKNTIQQIIPMTNNSGLVITSDKYILPNNEDINKIGIKPDIYVKNYNYKDIVLRKGIKLINEIVKKK